MTRTNYAVEQATSVRRAIAFRGIDGRQLAQQYALNRELGSERHHSGQWPGVVPVTVLPTGRDGASSGDVHPSGLGLMGRIAAWFRSVSAV